MGSKGYRHTEEAKRRISKARRERMARDGFLNTSETRKKIGEAKRGKPSKISLEGRIRLSEALRQRERSPEHMKKFADAGHAAARLLTEEKSASWRGDDVGYAGLQQWVEKHLGTPRFCEECGTHTAKHYHWTTVSNRRKRDLSDWIRLCRSCHWGRLHRDPWNKGKKTGKMTKRPGSRPDLKDNPHLFQPGQTAYNKGQARPEISGPNHPNWKGGVAPVHQMIRASIPYKQWRMAVFERDHFTCVLCGFRSSYHGRGRCDIRADHIKPFHQFPELRLEVTNGRTLCVPCDLAHGWQPWRQPDVVTAP